VLVLGPCAVQAGTDPVPITASQRRLVARLAATSDETVALAELADALWDGAPPPSARAAVHNQVSRLRAAAGRGIVETVGGGYRLGAPTDLDELRAAVRDAEVAIDVDPARALALAERARGLARGPALAELDDAEPAVRVREEVAGLLAVAADLEVTAALALGLVGRALPAAQRAAAAAPHDEGRAARLARTLAQAGRRGEALAVIARIRRALRTDLGLEVGVELERLEASIRGGALADVAAAPGHEVDDVLAAAGAGGAVLVVGGRDAAVTATLAAARDRLLRSGGAAVALVRAQGYRDVAVAALLDLLDLLGIDPEPALGPVGSFVPALETLARRRPVVLLVERFDAAGPSTRQALLAAARLEGVTLVAGAGREPAERFDAVVRLADRRDDARDGRLRRRLAALPPAMRDALTAAAVAGDGAPGAVLADLGLADGLDAAVAEGLLVRTADDEVSFADEALAAVVLADAPTGIREELHHALGHALARRQAREQAARHLLAAAAIEPPAAVAAARAAARGATEAGAHADAAAWLERAIAVSRDERERLALEIELGDARRLAGDPGHVDLLADAARRAERAGDDALLAEALFALLALGGTTVSTAIDPRIDALLSRAVASIGDARLAALVKAAGSLAWSMTGQADRSRRLFEEALATPTPPEIRRRVLPFAYMALGLPGDADARRRCADELLALAVEHDDPVARYEGLHLAFSVRLQEADGPALRRTHAEMTALVDRVGDVGRRWALQYLSAALAHLDGDLDAAERHAGSAFAQFAPVSESRATAALFGQLFGLRLVDGRVGELRPALEQLVADQPGVPAWNAALALGLVQADPPRAVATARRVLELVQEDFSWLVAHLVGARAAALVVRAGAADDDGLLEAYRRRLAPWSGRISWQGTCSYGPVDTTLALLAAAAGDDAGARRLAAAARAQAQRLQAPAFAAELAALGLDG
jgi:DNA-binding SARP family transcriptional activator